MDTSSSSKITVEYHDPSGVFPLIASDIASRLPLRNLNWQSATRPLRQIRSLHLEFVPDSPTNDSLGVSAPPPTQNGAATSLDIVRSGIDPRKNAARERRHQIPGLQNSPYLKLYILRADDKETYKSVERKKIKEWIRDNAVTNTKGKAESHEAFEWLIIHVVVPDTVASSEPRWRASSRDSEELQERKKGMKLPGKSTRTVFDKLRADFNESGKSGQDRVTQIRLTRAQVSADLLPTPAMATTIEETDEERERAWADLIAKFRTLILGPFDLRVRQYEADLAEQESRRAMPGFNFCTFFIYKEGLAKAFESVGLVDDALVIYDELSLGFETALKDLARGSNAGSATSFAPFTTDVVESIVGRKPIHANGDRSASRSNVVGSSEAFQKDYRDRIVRSNISVFDFSCYLFARQNALILRLANAGALRSGPRSGMFEAGEDLVLISEVCWRAASFIHNGARWLRQDLCAQRASQWEKQVAAPLSEADIESLVCSWTYIVAGQMLEQTYSSAIDAMVDPSKRESMLNGFAGVKHPAVSKLGGVGAYPQRTTSLPPRKSRTAEVQARESLQSASENDLVSPPLSPRSEEAGSTGPAPGLLELITYRAELLMMQRKMLETVAKQRRWVAGWALMEDRTAVKLETVDLDAGGEDDATNGPRSGQAASRLLAPALATALEDKDSFYTSYEGLSERAMRLYVAATQSKRAESIMGDLAILKYQQGDYNYSASYFQHVLPFYAEEGWSLMEVEALRMHSMCLKELGRKEEYVNTMLALACKACGWRKVQAWETDRLPTFDDKAHVSGVMPDALECSKQLDSDIVNPADLFFDGITVELEVNHFDDKDGFFLRMNIKHLLNDKIYLDTITARLVSLDDPHTEIWLAAENVALEHGMNIINLETDTTAHGLFRIDSITLQANKVLFVHKPGSDTQSSNGEDDLEHPRRRDPTNQKYVLLYPRYHGLDVNLGPTKYLAVDKPRRLSIQLRAGSNDVLSIDVKLRPATAGLRVHLADAVCNGIGLRAGENKLTGQISLDRLKPDNTATIEVPYSTEQPVPEIFVRLELLYTTAHGSFTFLTSTKLPTQLPIDVEVNDLFRTDFLLSTFAVRAMQPGPVVITNVACLPSTVYDIESPPVTSLPFHVFQQRPIKLIYKVTKRVAAAGHVTKKDQALTLNLKYCPAVDAVLHRLEDNFTTALRDSVFARFTRLLVPFLLNRVRKLISPSALESGLLSRTVAVPSHKDINWSAIVKTVLRTDELAEWLKVWHEKNATLKLDSFMASPEISCTMVIPVEVPSIDFVHDAALGLHLGDDATPETKGLLVLGEPVGATLTVHSSTSWRTSHSSTDQNKDFVYNIIADTDQWLVGGPKRGHFAASDQVEHTFEITLVPVKLGTLPLPQVDIQPRQQELSESAENGMQPEAGVSSEVHYASAGLVYRVHRALRMSRVFMPEASIPPKDAG